jgi:gamma-glutamylputrescine oxidase
MHSQQGLNYSYWELREYFRYYDLIIIGAGIVGLSTAISFKELNKKARVLVLERGVLPNGASTKNAGFACFGSAGELLADLQKINKESVWETVEMRYQGLALLRNRLGDKSIDYRDLGGFELFTDKKNFEACVSNLNVLNSEMKTRLGISKCYQSVPVKSFAFRGVKGMIRNNSEGQLDTGRMMTALLQFARHLGVLVLNGISVTGFDNSHKDVLVNTDAGEFRCSKLVVATNGFASQLLRTNDVLPARAQVLITEEIPGLKIRGTFHFNEGYYYFRNVDNRILLGGGRNEDIEGETTFEIGSNKKILKKLDHYLKTMILPDTKYKVAARWTGIMGVGNEKKPIIKFADHNVLAAVRMGGMGIAIGSLVGEKAARMLANS